MPPLYGVRMNKLIGHSIFCKLAPASVVSECTIHAFSLAQGTNLFAVDCMTVYSAHGQKFQIRAEGDLWRWPGYEHELLPPAPPPTAEELDEAMDDYYQQRSGEDL